MKIVDLGGKREHIKDDTHLTIPTNSKKCSMGCSELCIEFSRLTKYLSYIMPNHNKLKYSTDLDELLKINSVRVMPFFEDIITIHEGPVEEANLQLNGNNISAIRSAKITASGLIRKEGIVVEYPGYNGTSPTVFGVLTLYNNNLPAGTLYIEDEYYARISDLMLKHITVKPLQTVVDALYDAYVRERNAQTTTITATLV